MRTKPNTSGAVVVIFASQSLSWAVMPATAYSTPSSLPIVAGTTSSRRVASAACDVASVPLPTSGMNDPGDGAVAADVELDRSRHLAGGERLPLQLGDRVLDRRGA